MQKVAGSIPVTRSNFSSSPIRFPRQILHFDRGNVEVFC